MLLPRVITAIVGIPIILIAIKFGSIPFFITICGIILFALNEYFYLSRCADNNPYEIPGYILSFLLLLSIFLNGSKLLSFFEGTATSIVVSLILLFIVIIEILKRSPKGAIARLGVTLFGIMFITWMLSHLILLREIRPDGEKYTYFLFFLIWIVDTFAYFIGKKFGKSRIIEEISPGKTVEGAIGGFCAGAVFSIILWKLLGMSEFKPKEIVIVGVLISIIAFISDMGESLIKRDAGMKDSEKLLPGHGGIFDRFDSFILTAPFLYYYITIFHK